MEHVNSGRTLSGVRLAITCLLFPAAAVRSGIDCTIQLDDIDGSNGFVLSGQGPMGWIGQAVADGGDVNGDGIDDVLIAAPDASPSGRTGAGEVYIIYGSTTRTLASMDVTDIDGSNGCVLQGVAANEWIGLGLRAAGDLNADGVGDIIIGSGQFGAVRVVFGSRAGLPSPFDLSLLDGSNGFTLVGAVASEQESVSWAGDVNGDGVDDVIIGDLYAGKAYVVYGHSTPFPPTLDLSTLDGANGFTLRNSSVSEWTGGAAGAGDIDGDGLADIVIGAPFASPGGVREAGYVVFGRSAPFPAVFDLSTLDGTNGFVVDGATQDERAGRSVTRAGDVNGDGIDDIGISGDAYVGYVLFGSAGGFPPSLSLASLDGSNGFAIDLDGLTVQPAGDFDGDGVDDLIVQGWGPAVLLGRTTGFPARVDPRNCDVGVELTLVGGMWQCFAYGASGAGDVNGDGIADIVYGDCGHLPSGRGFVVYGRSETTVDYLLGEGLGAANGNRVRIFDRSQAATTADFLAYGAAAWGVNVGTGVIGDWHETQILTGPGPGAVYGPQVRAFNRLGSPLGKVNFYAYATLRYGVNVAAGSVDGDSFEEILTGAGPGAVFGPHVRVWNFDGTAVGAIGKLSFFAYGTLRYGVNVAEGDVDGDSYAEILTGPGPGPLFAPQVRGWNYDASSLSSIGRVNFLGSALACGVNVAAGDVDADGIAEIVTGAGPAPTNPPQVLGFDYDATAITALPGFATRLPGSTLYGGRIGLGDIDRDGAQDLLAGLGRDPAAMATVFTYSYDGAGLIPKPQFDPYPGDGYGVNVAAGAVGY